jgi:hypothetical protein
MARLKRTLLPMLVLLLSLVLVTTALAQGAQVAWYVMSSGGGHSGSTNYVVDGTMGQPAVGLLYSTNYSLGGGFWYVEGVPQVTITRVILPVVLKRYP